MNYEYLQDLFYALFPLCIDVKCRSCCDENNECVQEEELPNAVPLYSDVAIPIHNNYCETVTI